MVLTELANRRVAVLGINAAGAAAGALLCRRGARVTVAELPDEPAAPEVVDSLQQQGAEFIGALDAFEGRSFDLVVLQNLCGLEQEVVRRWREQGVPVLSALELGFQQSRCLHIALAGTNGKSTTAVLTRRLLEQAHRRVLVAGGEEPPLCDLVEQTAELDFVVVMLCPRELLGVEQYRPMVAVLLNLVSVPGDGMRSDAERLRAFGRLFAQQEPFDWAIVQSEALARLRAGGITVPSKVVTFSASNRRADLVLDRELLVSRLEDWTGPLLDLDHCSLQGVHFAEDLMAALIVGRVLRVPLEEMAGMLAAQPPLPGRCERWGEIRGVLYVNDARAGNLDSLQKALLSVPGAAGREANVILIAGGKDENVEFYDLGPLLSRRVKQAWLTGEAAPRMRAAWSLFTPCAPVGSVLEAVQRSAAIAVPGDVVLFSPACSCHGAGETFRQRGDLFREALQQLSPPPSAPLAAADAASNPVSAAASS